MQAFQSVEDSFVSNGFQFCELWVLLNRKFINRDQLFDVHALCIDNVFNFIYRLLEEWYAPRWRVGEVLGRASVLEELEQGPVVACCFQGRGRRSLRGGDGREEGSASVLILVEDELEGLVTGDIWL